MIRGFSLSSRSYMIADMDFLKIIGNYEIKGKIRSQISITHSQQYNQSQGAMLVTIANKNRITVER